MLTQRHHSESGISSPTMDRSKSPSPVSYTEELRAKARWIRDELEPSIARYGPRWLSPDIVLELNDFFHTLLAETNSKRLALTRQTLQVSRIHRALLLVTGRGTRWPSKLIELCDSLVEKWTERFGRLEMIRPTLYEKGGRLEKIKDEKDMKRHDLLLKWMSDPSSGCSPLRAQESGHLEFRPGHWWIHPLFAFHSGIIDSPDPHGGITADGDGAYAILLVGNDEITANSPEIFTYRCQNDDKGRFRLIAASLPPKNSIRVLRSHTLHSPWAPPAGVRYDGLYKIISWSVKLLNNKNVFEIGFQRELDQISMREARLHPTAEEVDDYIEYKRLKEERHAREESQRRAALTPSELEQEDATEEETQNLQDEPQILPMRKRYTSRHETADQGTLKSTTSTPILNIPAQGAYSPSRSLHLIGPASPKALGTRLDGSDSVLQDRRPSIRDIPIEESPLALELRESPTRRASEATIAALTRVRFCDEMTPAEIREEQLAWIRKDSGHGSRSMSNDSLTNYSSKASAFPLFDGSNDMHKERQSSVASSSSAHSHVPDHLTLQRLVDNIGQLREVTLRKDSVGSTFRDDLKGVSKVLEEWELECAENSGYVDSCLKTLEKDVHVMREHGRWDWQGYAGAREVSAVTELERLEEYQKRYEERVKEELREAEECADYVVGAGSPIDRKGLWTFGEAVVLN